MDGTAGRQNIAARQVEAGAPTVGVGAIQGDATACRRGGNAGGGASQYQAPDFVASSSQVVVANDCDGIGIGVG